MNLRGCVLLGIGRFVGAMALASCTAPEENPQPRLSIEESRLAVFPEDWSVDRYCYAFSPDGRRVASVAAPRNTPGRFVVLGGRKSEMVDTVQSLVFLPD